MTLDLNDSTALTNALRYYTAGHELLHLFTPEDRHARGTVNLLEQETTRIIQQDQTRFSDTKRLTERQQRLIHRSEYAKEP